MKTRIISGAVLALIGIVTGLIGGPVLWAVLLFCTLVGMYELYRAYGIVEDKKPLNPLTTAAYIGVIAYYLVLLIDRRDLLLPVLALGTMLVLAVYVVNFPKYHADHVIPTIFAIFYLGVMLSFMYQSRCGEDGIHVMWLIYISAWGADTMAYFTGRACGKHKMAPVLSPKKTVEGLIGGIAGAGLFGILFSLLFNGGENLVAYFIICLCGGCISVFGDLAASAIKRDKGIKDYGNLIPGHGGILDRFDSILFTAPVIYFLQLLLI
ncbi:MAG: phosphatidate cytidylyltransferase [Lachnospiraceae bacterium]|nr:phosphatidate cytidylyltransferase [Lachnospiraceae bacterium]